MKKFLLLLIIFLSTFIYSSSFPDRPINRDKRVQISKLYINIDFTGGIAETTVDITYFNPSEKYSDIQLEYPVNSRQRLITFTTGTDSSLQKSSIKVVNKRSDNLDSLSIINRNLIFNIVKIPPNGYKKLRFKIQEELLLENNKYSYLFPFTYDKSITDFTLCAKVFSNKVFDGIWDSEILIDYQKNNYYLDKPINLVIPEKGFNQWVDSTYFYTNVYIGDGYQLAVLKTEKITEVYTDLEVQSNLFNITGVLEESSGKIILKLLDSDGKQSEKEILIAKKDKNGPLNIEKLWAYKKIDYLSNLKSKDKKVIEEISNNYKLFIPGFSYVVENSVGAIKFD